MNGAWYGTLGSDMVGRGLKLYRLGSDMGGPDMVGHVPTLLAKTCTPLLELPKKISFCPASTQR